jgi:hypothetical protein
MSRAPKRIWWCPRKEESVDKLLECHSYYKGSCFYESNILECIAKPYVPEKGGER